MKKMQGFTLGEVLIVMVIAGILSASAVSGWQRWQQQQRLNDTARQVQLFLMRLRSEANWHNVPRLLWLLPGGAGCLGSGPVAQVCDPKNRLAFRGPGGGIQLLSLTPETGFYGRRSVAKPGRVIIAGQVGERHILISSRGRVRICQPEKALCQ
ncbi:prepilin-type N-terminal cleavage/methylation domain-containing protein [Erwinia sp. P6884]|uniref:prepilin-type N-terminal cleavage/methylation domain-containing protein n=1 Tax=Erwinia sp. P6884 TaxID=3141450 RepID=UPI0031915354